MSEHAMPDCPLLAPNPVGPSGITGATSGLIASCWRSSLEAMSSCATKQTVVDVACPPAVSQRGVFCRLAKLPSSGGAPILSWSATSVGPGMGLSSTRGRFDCPIFLPREFDARLAY